MAVVTTDEGRGDSRDVYVPRANAAWPITPTFRRMAIGAHCSDGQSRRNSALPGCSISGRQRRESGGPPNAECRSGAWSPDGKWIYLTAKTDAFHIWRQRFPDGQPEQLTFGPTSQEGIAMAPDGKSLITAVGSQDSTVWMHDRG